MHNLADVYRNQGKFEQAEKLYTQAIDIWLQTVEADHLALANAYNNLALLYIQQRKYEQAKALYLKAFVILIKVGNIKHTNMTILVNNYAALLKEMGQKILLPQELSEHYEGLPQTTEHKYEANLPEREDER